MQLQQIRYFLAICKSRSFTGAAHQCGVSQPSLTQAIKRLELELGGRLLSVAAER
jgi:LysR family hydrogen peroxide-inducible transcriptional activator